MQTDLREVADDAAAQRGAVTCPAPRTAPVSPQSCLCQLWQAALSPALRPPSALRACLLSSLAGVFRGGHDILVRSRLLLLDTVTMQVTARSSEELPVDIVLASVG